MALGDAAPVEMATQAVIDSPNLNRFTGDAVGSGGIAAGSMPWPRSDLAQGGQKWQNLTMPPVGMTIYTEDLRALFFPRIPRSAIRRIGNII